MTAWLRDRWYWLAAVLAAIVAGLVAVLVRRPRPPSDIAADLGAIDAHAADRAADAGEVRTAARAAIESGHGLAEERLDNQQIAKAAELAAGDPAALSAYLDDTVRRIKR